MAVATIQSTRDENRVGLIDPEIPPQSHFQIAVRHLGLAKGG
jgi:hypothetical protein